MKILLIMLILILISGCDAPIEECFEDYKEDKIMNNDWNCPLEPSRCMVTCEDYNAKYFRFDRSGFGSNECWCNQNGTPLQVY